MEIWNARDSDSDLLQSHSGQWEPIQSFSTFVLTIETGWCGCEPALAIYRFNSNANRDLPTSYIYRIQLHTVSNLTIFLLRDSCLPIIKKVELKYLYDATFSMDISCTTLFLLLRLRRHFEISEISWKGKKSYSFHQNNLLAFLNVRISTTSRVKP